MPPSSAECCCISNPSRLLVPFPLAASDGVPELASGSARGTSSTCPTQRTATTTATTRTLPVTPGTSTLTTTSAQSSSLFVVSTTTNQGSDVSVACTTTRVSLGTPAVIRPVRPTSLELPARPSVLIGSNLISPDTPRPQKAFRQTFIDGHAYSTLGLKVSTRSTYCCIYRPQPMFVLQETDPGLSMYSNWVMCPFTDELKLGGYEIPATSMRPHKHIE